MAIKPRLLYILLASLSACATNLPLDNQNITTQHVVSKNFAIGAHETAFVGDPVIKMKDYWVTASAQKAWRLDNATHIHGGILNMMAPPGDYGIIGRKELNGKAYDLIEIRGAPILVDPEGHPAEIMNNIRTAAYGVSTEPPGMRMTPVQTTSVETARGYVNFEIVYTGLSNGTIHLLYREYSPDDLAKTAFYQDLSYDASQPEIRFRDIHIHIDKATNQQIDYEVEMAPSIT